VVSDSLVMCYPSIGLGVFVTESVHDGSSLTATLPSGPAIFMYLSLGILRWELVDMTQNSPDFSLKMAL
jgi:hypothetical protein